jgi:flagellar protein FliO/FliZ
MMAQHSARAVAVAAALCAFAAEAQTGATPVAAAVPPAPGIGAGQVFGLFAGTLLVLAVIGGIAWLMKRMAPRGYGSGGVLRVVAGAAVGQRERVVVVEVGGNWLVVGVAPGSVNLLQQMPRAEVPAVATTALPSTAFAAWLKQVMEKRNGR